MLLKTTAPLETLDLSKTCMSSVGVKLVAELLVPDGEGQLLPLKKLVLHGNSIGPDGYAAIGAAMRHPRCGLREFVVSTQIKEKKTGQNRISKTEEHNCVQVAEIRSVALLCVDFFADPELIILSEVLLLNTTLHAIELRKNKVGDDGVEALARAVGRGNLPIKTVHLETNQLSSMGATQLVRGLMEGGCPLEELVIADNAITVSAEAVRRRKAEGEREAELRKLAAVSRATPASEWARAQLHVRAVVADRTRQGAPRTALMQEDFAALLALPKELREDRWEALGGLYGPPPPAETAAAAAASSASAAAELRAAATAATAAALGFYIVAPPAASPSSPTSEGEAGGVPAAARSPRHAAVHASVPSQPVVASQHVSPPTPAAAAQAHPPEPLLPSPKQLARLAPEQLQLLWTMVTAPPPPEEQEVYRTEAVQAVCTLLGTAGNTLSFLELSTVGLCGVDGADMPLLGCTYTGDAVALLCEALGSEHCTLHTLKLSSSRMRPAEASRLAEAIRGRASRPGGAGWQAVVIETSQLPVPQLLGMRELSGGQHKRLCTNCVKLEPSEVKFISELLRTNPLLEALELNGSLIGDGTPWLSAA